MGTPSAGRCLTRTLSIAGVAVLVAIAVMAIVGWVIVGTSHSPGHRRFNLTVINDRSDAVAIQPCARFFCDKFRPVNLAAGRSYTWQTTDGDAGVHSFVVEISPHGRILGCLGQRGVDVTGDQIAVRVSDLQECVS
jgi:hypothetical protein